MYNDFRPSDRNDLVLICNRRHIIGETERALHMRIGQTLYGEPITAFFPKQACKTRSDGKGGQDIYVPAHLLRSHQCYIGNTAQNRQDYEGYDNWEDTRF